MSHSTKLFVAAIDIVRQAKSYHILLIIADGQVDAIKDTTDAIVEATNYPLSIVCIGVGDGPWDLISFINFKNETADYIRCKNLMINFQNANLTTFNLFLSSKQWKELKIERSPLVLLHCKRSQIKYAFFNHILPL
jgi:hypothetical protein